MDSPEATTAPSPSGQNAQPSRQFPLAVALVAVTGFISLSYEILWVRVYSFATGGMAGAFAMLLGSYLLGIALGSLVARRFCRTTGASDHRQLRNLGVFVLAANLVGFAVVPAVAFLLQHVMYWWTLGVVVIAAAGLGASFPLICHFGIPPDDRAGARLSQLYLANIVGASAGSLATGFIFVSIWSLQGISTFLALFGLALAGGIFAMSGLQGRARVKAAGGMALAVAAVALSATPMFEHVHEKLQLKKHYKPGFEFARIHESRGGIVTIKKSSRVYGNGIYDGKLSTNLVKDINGIARVFSMSALHPAPKRVLEIGLSMGAWAQVIANHPQVEELTIIEIDEGYLDLIPHYPLVASVLDHPKVEIIIDDGRRWLLANPDARFDAIVMNTTFGWRAHSSGLLSVEFLELVRGHLAEGGFAQYNTTFSGRAYATGLKVFPHAVRIWNNLAVSDTPFDMDKRRWRSVLERYEIDGKPVFDLTKGRHRRRLDAVVRRLDGVSRRRGRKQYMEGRRSLMRRMGKRAVITDDNMGTEWGHAAALKSALKYSK